MGTEFLNFGVDAGIPNNPNLAVVLRRGIDAIVDAPEACEELFARNGWVGTWRNGIFAFHHFHSNAHEVLGIVSGSARVLLGGPGGTEVTLAAGDVVVLPAGTGHKRESGAADLLVIGGYPPGQEGYDLRRGDPAELDEVTRNVAAVPLPATDPVAGPDGALIEAWGPQRLGRPDSVLGARR